MAMDIGSYTALVHKFLKHYPVFYDRDYIISQNLLFLSSIVREFKLDT